MVDAQMVDSEGGWTPPIRADRNRPGPPRHGGRFESSQMSNTNRFDRHRRVVLTFFTLFLVLAADFVGKRIYEVYKERTHPDLDKRFRVRSPIYHHDLKSNVSVEGRVGETRPIRSIRIPWAFATRWCGRFPHQFRPRVLFIGDSFTEAPVSWEESFVGIIARDSLSVGAWTC